MKLAELLRKANVEPILAGTIGHEPEVADVDRLAQDLRERSAGPGDFLLGLGGGAALDLAKAAAALVTNRHGHSVRDFLEGVGAGLQITEASLPFLAMPTTGGTGTEATKNAVISVADPPVKKSIRSPRMIAKVVLVDPGIVGQRFRRNDRVDRHGRDHAIDRKLYLPIRQADPASARGRRLAASVAEGARSGAGRFLSAGS